MGQIRSAILFANDTIRTRALREKNPNVNLPEDDHSGLNSTAHRTYLNLTIEGRDIAHEQKSNLTPVIFLELIQREKVEEIRRSHPLMLQMPALFNEFPDCIDDNGNNLPRYNQPSQKPWLDPNAVNEISQVDIVYLFSKLNKTNDNFTIRMTIFFQMIRRFQLAELQQLAERMIKYQTAGFLQDVCRSTWRKCFHELKFVIINKLSHDYPQRKDGKIEIPDKEYECYKRIMDHSTGWGIFATDSSKIFASRFVKPWAIAQVTRLPDRISC